MKSFAIKTNSNIKENYILEQLEDINLNDFYISSYQFKIFKNIIVHYKGDNLTQFQKKLSEKIANTIEQFYAEDLLYRIIKKHYFYLEEEEQLTILKISYKIFASSREQEEFGREILKDLIYDYVEENNKMILEGFVNFRIKEYIETLDYIVELAVTSYLNFVLN